MDSCDRSGNRTTRSSRTSVPGARKGGRKRQLRDQDKTREQLIQELTELRLLAAELKERVDRNGREEPAEGGRVHRAGAIAEELGWKTALLEAQINSSLDGILVVDGNGRKILQNQRTIDLWKIPKEIAEDPDDDRQARHVAESTVNPREFLDQVIYLYDHPSETSRDEIALKDGTVLDRYSSPVIGKDGTYYGRVWTFRDITERTKADDELRTSRLKLKEAAAMARIAYWEYDRATDEFVFNDGFYDLYATTAEREGGYRMASEEYVRRFVHPDDVEELTKRVKDDETSLRTRERYEHRVIRGDGEVIHVLARNRTITDEDGRPVRCIGVNQDITARIRMVEALRESELRMRSITDSAKDGIVMMDPEGLVSYWNPAAEAIFGYPAAEAIGRSLHELLAPARYLDTFQTVLSPFAKDGYGALLGKTTDLEGRRKDGEEISIQVSLSAIRIGDGWHAIGVVRDVTEKKHLEEQLRQAQKMEAVGTLAGGIAHDFNNMLAVIIGNAELALDNVRQAGPRRNIKQIVEASKRAKEFVRQILTFSRKAERQKAPLRLAPLLEETFNLLRSSLPSTIRMALEVRAPSDTIIGDASQIEQVVMNLATNAAYAMRQDGGKLSIGLSNVSFDHTGRTPEPDMEPGRYVKLWVKDSGVGITEEVRRKMFEPFFTTKEPGQGTGMGLAVVFGIVKSHGGAISVESEPGEGSSFSVFLPCSESPVMQEPQTTTALPQGKEKILLVDDEAAIIEAGSQTLMRLGYDVTTAMSGTEALAIFLEKPHGFDLVITDQTMPHLTGSDLAIRMLEARKDLPIILMTGYSETLSPEKAKSLGITELIMKPIDKRGLAVVIRDALERSR